MSDKKIYLIILLSLLQFACNEQKQQRSSIDVQPPEIVAVKGYVVPQDKIAPPEITPVKEIKLQAVRKPKVIPFKSNVYPVGKPAIVKAGAPKICIPGKDSFSLPKIAPVLDSPFTAGIPEVTIAKDPQINDNNLSSFSSFKVLQGLKTNMIFPIIQDRAGNMWIACFEGGVSKYDGRSFTNYSTAQGLSNDNVWCMLEDSKGNLWFGTLGGGVNKFDGKSFTHYSINQGVSDKGVISILEDKKGNLWFGTEVGGVNKFDGKIVTHYTTAQGLAGNHVRSIIEDSKGNLWFGTNSGVSKFDGNAFSNYTTAQGLSNANIMCILEDRKGNLWISTSGGGINKYDGRVFEQYSTRQGLHSTMPDEIKEDRTGSLWFTINGEGVIKYDGKSFTQFGIDQGLSSTNVHSILEDKAGNLWLGTGDGLYRYHGNTFTHYNSSLGFSEGGYHSIFEDKTGNLWLGIYGGGVNKFDGKSVTHYNTEQGLTDNHVMCLLKDSTSDLWVGTQFGALYKYDGKCFMQFANLPPSTGVWSILKDSKRNIWFGTSEGLYKYDGKNFTHFGIVQGLSWKSICSITEDKDGNLWLGTELDGVINKLDLSAAETGRYSFTHYNLKKGSGSSIVYSIVEDKNRNLWFGTHNAGVIKFDGKVFTHYTTAQGLSSNSVNSIVEDKEGNMWFLTRNGLCKMQSEVNNRTGKTAPGHRQISLFSTYLYADGFLGVGSHFNSMILGRNGNIWAGTGNRLTCYHPEGDVPDTIPPTIQLRGIALFNENVNWFNLEKKQDTSLILSNGTRLKDFAYSGLSPWYNQPENLQLDYYNNYITFQFIGITINRPQAVRSQYFLEGLDEAWSSITDRPDASYSNLPHGKYTFKIKSVNSEGYWSQELHYPFIILPPWWRTWWAYAFYGIALSAGILGLFYYRSRNLRRELEHRKKEQLLSELQQQKTELEMQALRAQMNPHFIFNSLSSINRFILKNDKTQASQYLTKFSKLVRLILQNSQAALIPLESELEALQLYLELEALRFDNQFSYVINIAPDLDVSAIKVPPLLIQPFVENAIWHGLMHKEEKGHLKIEILQQRNVLCCRITDDGIGRQKAAELKSKSTAIHDSMGMRITADRIALLKEQSDTDTRIIITDLLYPDGTPAGTEVLFKILMHYA